MQPDPAGRIHAPAIGLMVTGGLGVGFTLLWMVLLGIFGVAIIGDADAREALPGIGIWMALSALSLALSAFTLYAGWQMRQIRNWTLCMAGTICAMLPCSVCCVLGLPIGIWALIVLLDNEIKQLFAGGGDPTGGYGPPPGAPEYPPQA